MNKHYDYHFKTEIVTIYPGEYYVSSEREIISTVLGSCISVCLYDLENGIGGMNHFMLPKSSRDITEFITNNQQLKPEGLVDKTFKYGIHAMEVLISALQKKGADRNNIRAKIFGGGNVLQSVNQTPSVGEKNIKFTKSFLKTEMIPIDNQNIGERCSRKIYFLTGSSSIFVKRLPIYVVEQEELKYRKSISDEKPESDITIY